MDNRQGKEIIYYIQNIINKNWGYNHSAGAEAVNNINNRIDEIMIWLTLIIIRWIKLIKARLKSKITINEIFIYLYSIKNLIFIDIINWHLHTTDNYNVFG